MPSFDLNAFLTETRPYVFALVYRISGQEAETDDIVQNTLVETFMECSRNPDHQPSRREVLKRAWQLLKSELISRKPWNVQDVFLVEPIITDAKFWASLKNESEGRKTAVAQPESLSLGFLSMLQRLAFMDRMIFVLARVLGWSLDDVAAFVDSPAAKVHEALSRADELMAKNYFRKDSAKMLWRSEPVGKAQLESFLEILNGAHKDDFKSVIDADFRCLLVPAPVLEAELFFNDFLTVAPRCRMIDAEINGQRAFVFEDNQETQALAVLIESKNKVASVLGYDLEELSPKLRAVTETMD